MIKRIQKGKLILMSILTMFLFVGVLNVSADQENVTISTGDSNIITNTGSLTVTGVNTDDSLSAYKILNAYYSNNSITYQFTDLFSAFLSSEYASTAGFSSLTVDSYLGYTSGSGSTSDITLTSDINKLAGAFAQYIRANINTISTTYASSVVTLTTSGTSATATGVTVGAYLVLPTSTTKVYGAMIGNVEITADSGTWTLKDGQINAKASDVGITKTANNASATIGDDITYTIVGTVPTYPSNALSKTYTITDTLTDGLDFAISSTSDITILDGETQLTISGSDGSYTASSGSNTVATITISGRTMTIVFDADYITSNTVTVTYKARLNSNAYVGTNGNLNTNTAELTYSNDPYTSGSSTSTSTNTTVNTYGLTIYKTDGSTGLSGAVFEIRKGSSDGTVVGTITTENDGYGSHKGLAEGEYYLIETTAPTGYVLNSTPIKVVIGSEYNSSDTTVSYEDSTGYYTATILNTAQGSLPFTGSVGTIVITGIGLVIIIGAVCFYVKSRNNKKTGKIRK